VKAYAGESPTRRYRRSRTTAGTQAIEVSSRMTPGAGTTLNRQALPDRALSFFPPIFVPATRLTQRGSARQLARTGRTRTDRMNPCNSRPDWAGPEEAVADDRRRETEPWSGITRCKVGRRGKRRAADASLLLMARASRSEEAFKCRRRICSVPGSLSRTRIRSAPTAIR
jgi:hypothetical protein